MSQKTKHTISCFFLLAFLFLKVAALHGITHKDDLNAAKNCPLCHLTIHDNHTPLLAPGQLHEVIVAVSHQHTKVVNHYISIASEKKAVCSIFNRPPPVHTV